jgi:hypothetical protein
MGAYVSHIGPVAGSRDRPTLRVIVRIGVIAGLAAGMVMAMWQMIVGAIATEPTDVAGIDSSFWTAVTSIPSVLFGQEWFHGSFEFGAVFLGLMGHMMNSAMIGIAGVALVATLFGGRIRVAPAMVIGMTFGLVVEAVLLNGVVNQIQDVNTVYSSTPEWSWWVAHAMFGATVGLVSATLLRHRGEG